MNRFRSYRRIGNHLLFWLMFLAYRLATSTSQKSLVGEYWWGDWKVVAVLVVETIFKAIFAYGFIYFILPRFLDSKKYTLFAISTLAWLYFVVTLYTAFHFYYLEHVFTIYLWWDHKNMATMFLRMTNVGFLMVTLSNFVLPTIIFAAIKFYERKMQLSKIKEEKNKMELVALKNQLNPHFLFNTLNNLYSSVVNNSPRAPDMIMRLSGILDYALYKSQSKSVALSEEVTAIENFIELEKIRYGDRLQLSFTHSGIFSSQISPLLLLSLVENAFKHGASGDIEKPTIAIELKEENKNIYFRVWNSKAKEGGILTDEHKKGIGLSNIRRQLKLIYPQNHDLVLREDEKTYDLTLTISPLV